MQSKHDGSLTFQLKDALKITGSLKIIIQDKDGKIINEFEDANIVVNGARTAMKSMIAGDTVANFVISAMKFGDGGHDPAHPTQPVPVSVTDTDIYGTTVITKATTYDYPDGPTGTRVRFSATIARNEGNGTGSQAISEVGLFCANGTMFAHKTFGLLTKTSEFSMTFQWTIVF